MTAKEILNKAKALFNSVDVVPAVPAQLQTSFPVDGQQPVYVEGDALALNSPVYLDAGMTMPYPDGAYTITGGQPFTVAGGIVTAIGDAAPAAQQQAPTAPPAVLPQMPPMFEAQMAAHKTELETVKGELKAAQQTISKLNQIIPDLFALVEKLTELPVSEPKTLNERQQVAFNRAQTREEKLQSIANNIKKLKTT